MSPTLTYVLLVSTFVLEAYSSFTPIQKIYSSYQSAGIAFQLNIPQAITHATLIENCVKNFAATHNASSLHEQRLVRGLKIQVHDLARNRRNLQTLLDYAGQEREDVLPQADHPSNQVEVFEPSRIKRGINFDVNVAEIVGSLFNGIYNIFNGHKQEQLSSAIKNVATIVSRHEAQQRHINLEVVRHIRQLQINAKRHNDAFSFSFLASRAIEAASAELEALQTSIQPISTGYIPSSLLDPATAATALVAVKELALQNGHQSLATVPGQLYRAPFTSFRYVDQKGRPDIGVIISIPMVKLQDQFQGWRFHNLPAKALSPPHQPLIWNTTATAVIGVKTMGLWPNIDSLQLSDKQLADRCTLFANVLLCHVPVRPTSDYCPVSLKYRERAGCEAVPFSGQFDPLWIGPNLVLFSADDTMLFRSCPGSAPTTTPRKGLIVLPDSSLCTTIFGDLSIPPRPASETTLVHVNRSAMERWSDDLSLTQHDLRTVSLGAPDMELSDQMADVVNRQNAARLEKEAALRAKEEESFREASKVPFNEIDDQILLAATVFIALCVLACLAFFIFHAYRNGMGPWQAPDELDDQVQQEHPPQQHQHNPQN